MSEINQKLGFDASSAINSLRTLQQMMNQTNQSMGNFAISAKKFNDQARPMAGMLDRMGTSAQKVTSLLDKLGLVSNKAAAGVGNLAQKPQGFAANMQYFDQLQKNIIKAKEAREQLQNKPPVPDPDPGKRSLGFLKTWKDIASTFKSMIIITALRKIANEFLGAIEAARKFGIAIAEIQTIGQGLGMTNDQLSRKILDLSSALGKSAQDVAEGLYQTISNQVVEAADAFELLTEAQQLAITTQATTAQSIDALSSVMNSYSLSISDATRVSGILFETVNLGRLRLGDIADRIGRITPMAAQMGVRFEELGAAIATMTVQGVKADTAITQVRAILSKLQKPTEELQKIFRAWGVKDGPEAIKSFGGLAGVLRKLSKETGGSSSEMAEFFNVVRAMTGVMSLNTNEGRKFAEALEKMDQAASKATVAWRTFIQSDAYGLTKSVNALKNAFIELGEELIPVAKAAADLFNWAFGDLGKGIDFMRMAGNTSKAVQKYIELQTEAINKKRRDGEQEFTRFNGAEWRKREQAVRESLAKMGQDFNKYMVEMELAQKASTNVFKGFTDDMVKNWDDAFNKIKGFADNARDRIKSNVDAMRGLQDRIDDLHYDNALNRAQSDFQKFNLMANQASSLLQKAFAEAAQAGTDPDKFAAAMKSYERAAAAAEKGLQEARSAGNEAEVRRFTAILEQSLGAQKNEYAQLNDEIEKNIPLAEEAMAKYSEKGKLLKEWTDEYVSSMEREQKANSDSEKEAERNLRQRLKESIQNLDFGPEADIMEKLGLDPASLTRLNWQIKDIFNMKDLEWQGAQESLQAALDKMSLKAKVELTPEIRNLGFEEFGKKMGLAEKPGEGPAQYYQRVYDEAKAAVEGQNRLNNELAAGNALMEEGQKVADGNFFAASKAITKYLDMYRQRDIAESKKLYSSEMGFRWDKTVLNERLAMYQKEEDGYQRVLGTLTEYYDAIKAGNPLTEEQTNYLGNLKIKLDELGSAVPADIKNGILEMGAGLQKMSDGAEKAKQATDAIAENADKATFGNLLLENIEALDGKTIELLNKINGVSDATQNGVQPWNNQRDAAGGTQDAVNELNNSVSMTTDRAYNAADAFWAMADAANAAALAGAAANSTAGGYAYHGGAMNFLAAGGRGQDVRPAMLAKGEYVVKAGAAARFFSELNAMNQGSRPVYREQGGSVTNVGDVNVTVKGGDTGQQTVREIGYALRREIKRNNIKLK